MAGFLGNKRSFFRDRRYTRAGVFDGTGNPVADGATGDATLQPERGGHFRSIAGSLDHQPGNTGADWRAVDTGIEIIS